MVRLAVAIDQKKERLKKKAEGRLFVAAKSRKADTTVQ